jgi:hypothetical protein
MIEIRALKPSEWVVLIDTFEKEFDSDLPSPDHATIYGAFEDGKLAGFVLAEEVTFIGQIHVKDPKNSATLARKMIRFLRERTPDNKSVATVASESRFEMLFRTLGMQKISGTLFRRNSK